MTTPSRLSRLPRRNPQARRPISAMRIALLMLMAMSTLGTFLGFHSLLDDIRLLASPELNSALALVLAAVVTAAVQLLLYHTVTEMLARGASLLTRLLMLGGYLLTMAVSVGFALAFWFSAIRGQDYAVETFQATAWQVTEEVSNVASAYQGLLASSQQLSDHASQMARIEDAQGGTCGGPAMSSKGPNWRLRQRDAGTFAAYTPHFTARATELDGLVQTLQQQIKQADPLKVVDINQQVRQSYLRLRGLLNDPVIGEYHARIASRLAEFATGSPDADSGKLVRCNDQGFATLLRNASTVQLPQLSEPSFRQYDPQDPKDSLNLAFERIWHFLGNLPSLIGWAEIDHWYRNGGSQQPASAATRFDPDSVPVALALCIDLLILLCAMMEAATLRNQPVGWTPLERLQGSHSKLQHGFLARIGRYLGAQGGRQECAQKLLNFIEEHLVWQDNANAYLILPTFQGNGEAQLDQIRRQRLLRLLASLQAVRLQKVCSKRQPDWLQYALDQRRWKNMPFSLYQLDASFLRALSLECVLVAEPEDDGPDNGPATLRPRPHSGGWVPLRAVS